MRKINLNKIVIFTKLKFSENHKPGGLNWPDMRYNFLRVALPNDRYPETKRANG